MPRLQTDESSRNPDLREQGGQKNIEEMGKGFGEHSEERKQNVRKAELFQLDEKKQDNAKVAKNQREILDEEKEVQPEPLSQDQGTSSSNKNELTSSCGENPLCNVNHEEEKVAHREHAMREGATEEISMVKLHTLCVDIC